jgi:hypothetical protein
VYCLQGTEHEHCSHPHAPTNAHNLYAIKSHPCTWALLHVSAINQHPQGDSNTKEHKINKPIYIYTVSK